MHKWRILAASTALLLVGLGLGCEGFFVDPVLTGIAVGPAATVQIGTTIQLTALGTFNDGSQKKVLPHTFWSSGTASVAIMSQSELVSGVGPGQSVITAASELVSGRPTM